MLTNVQCRTSEQWTAIIFGLDIYMDWYQWLNPNTILCKAVSLKSLKLLLWLRWEGFALEKSSHWAPDIGYKFCTAVYSLFCSIGLC